MKKKKHWDCLEKLSLYRQLPKRFILTMKIEEKGEKKKK